MLCFVGSVIMEPRTSASAPRMMLCLVRRTLAACEAGGCRASKRGGAAGKKRNARQARRPSIKPLGAPPVLGAAPAAPPPCNAQRRLAHPALSLPNFVFVCFGGVQTSSRQFHAE